MNITWSHVSRKESTKRQDTRNREDRNSAFFFRRNRKRNGALAWSRPGNYATASACTWYKERRPRITRDSLPGASKVTRARIDVPFCRLGARDAHTSRELLREVFAIRINHPALSAVYASGKKRDVPSLRWRAWWSKDLI